LVSELSGVLISSVCRIRTFFEARSDWVEAPFTPVPLDGVPFASRALWAGAWAWAGRLSPKMNNIAKIEDNRPEVTRLEGELGIFFYIINDLKKTDTRRKSGE
jgi:hypothetical protein